MGISTLLSFSSLVFLINVMHQESGNHQTLKRDQNLFLIFMIKDENTPSQFTVLTSEIFQLLWNYFILNNKKYFVIFTQFLNLVCIFGTFYSLKLFYFFVTFCCIKPQSVRDWSEGNILCRAWRFWSHNDNEKFGIVALFAIINILFVFFWLFFSGHQDDIVIFYLPIYCDLPY